MDASQGMHGRRRWGGLSLPAAVKVGAAVAACVLATGALFWQAHRASLASYHRQLANDGDVHVRQLERELRGCLVATKALQQLLASGGGRTRASFAGFVQPLLAERAEIQALEWVPLVRSEDRGAFIAAARREAGPAFDLLELDAGGDLVPAAEREVALPVYFAEPRAGNERAVGFDLASRADRRAALDAACDAGAVRTSGRIRLVQEEGDEYGFILAAPVYRPGAPVETIEQRRAALEGFALGVFRAGDLLRASLSPAPRPGLAFSFVDEDAPPIERTLHVLKTPAAPAPRWRNPIYPAPERVTRTFAFAGRTWGLDLEPDATFLRQNYPIAHWLIWPAGLGSTVLLGLLLHGLARRREQLRSEFRQQSQLLSLSRRQGQLMSELVPVGAIEWDAGFRVVRWNRSAEQIFGYTAEEAIGQHASLIVPAAARSAVDALFRDLLALSGGLRSSNANRTKSGALIQCEWYNAPLLGPDGTAQGVLSFVEDVTARAQAEAALAASERRYRTLFETMSQGVIFRDRDGRISSANPAAAQILGVPPDELVGRGIEGNSWDYLDEEGHPLPTERHPAAIALREQRPVLNQLVGFRFRADASNRWALISSLPLPGDMPGELAGTCTTFTDITDRKVASNALQRTLGRLQHINAVLRSVRAIDELIADQVEPAALLEGACRILVQTRGYRVAWIGEAAPETGELREVAAAAIDPAQREPPPGRAGSPDAGPHPCATALRERRVVVASDGAPGGALAAIPFPAEDGPARVLLLGSIEAPFDEEALELLTAIVRKLAHSLRALASEEVLTRTREDLIAREREYKLMVSAAIDGFWVFDLEGRILDCNESAVAQTGYARQDVIGMSIRQLVAPEDEPSIAGHIERIVSASADRFELRGLTRERRVVELEISANFLPYGGGRIFAFSRDISDRKRREEAQRRYQLSLQAARDAFLLVGRDGRIVEANDAAIALYGRTREELLRTHIQQLRVEDPPELIRAQMEAAWKDGVLFETFHLRADGRPIPVEVSSRGVVIEGRDLLLSVVRDITARRRAEEALRASEQRMAQVAEVSGELIWELDVHGVYTYVSDLCEPMLGYRPDELIGRMRFVDLLPDADPDNARASAFAAFAHGGKVEAYPTSLRTKRGRLLHVLSSCVPILGEGGRLLGYRGSDRDITERVLAEEELRETKETYRQLVEEINDALFETDARGVLTYVSPAFLQTLGCSASEAIGSPFEKFVAEGDRGQSARARADALQNRAVPLELRMVARDGGQRWARISARPRLRNGRILGVRGTLIDITENRQSQQALWISEERFRTLVEKAADSFVLVDEQGTVQYASPPIFRSTGRRPEEVIGRGFVDHVHPESRAETQAALAGLLARPGASTRLCVRIAHTDGSWRLLDAQATNLLHHEAVRAILITCQDITQRDSLERQLRHAQKMEAIGTLAGGIAHDFNNMLFAISGYATLGLKRAARNRELRRDLEEILVASRRSADLVHQLLLFSRQREEPEADIPVKPILKETFRLLRSTLPATIRLRLEMPAAHDRVRADPVQLQQVMMNLATNAFHAMRQAGGELSLTLEERSGVPVPSDVPAHDDWLCLVVRDTGCGIQPEHLERLFEPFFTTKPVGEGTGLGLAVVHGIVAAAHGFIRVESAVGKGTCFRVFLPLQPDAEAGAAPEPAAAPAGGPRLRVLCVDDESTLTAMLKRILEEVGFEVTTFNESPAALEALKRAPDAYDVVLTDQTMPVLTGLQLVREARAAGIAVPAVLITGYGTEHVTPAQCRELDAVHLAKPVRQDLLIRTLREAAQSAKEAPTP